MDIRNLDNFITPQPTPEEQAVLDLVYESPITLVADQMRTEMEANCVKVVQNYGFDVNAEELAKALAYDRDQYDKGYAAARQKYERPRSKWLVIYTTMEDGTIRNAFRCLNCRYVEGYKSPFCAKCGADMRPEEAET